MSKIEKKFCAGLFLWLLFFVVSGNFGLFAQIEKFLPKQGGNIEVWRITSEPTIRDWANYQNTQCWSPDGRYVCYVRYKQYEDNPESEVHIYDFFENKDIKVDRGTSPRWANNHNWLFYVRRKKGASQGKENEVMWLDVDSKKLVRIGYGATTLGETDSNDRWIYG